MYGKKLDPNIGIVGRWLRPREIESSQRKVEPDSLPLPLSHFLLFKWAADSLLRCLISPIVCQGQTSKG